MLPAPPGTATLTSVVTGRWVVGTEGETTEFTPGRTTERLCTIAKVQGTIRDCGRVQAPFAAVHTDTALGWSVVRWFRFPRTLGIVVALYLAGMAVLFGVLSEQGSQFVDTAQRTTGTVLALVPKAPAGARSQPANARMVSLAPQVSYVVADKTYDYTAAHGRFHQPLKVGDTVQVLYDPADPSVARLKGEGQVLVPGITTSFAVAAVLVVFLLVKTRRLGVGVPRRDRAPEPVDAGRPPPRRA